MILVSHTGIFFVKENPDRWENYSSRRETELLTFFSKERKDQNTAAGPSAE